MATQPSHPMSWPLHHRQGQHTEDCETMAEAGDSSAQIFRVTSPPCRWGSRGGGGGGCAVGRLGSVGYNTPQYAPFRSRL